MSQAATKEGNITKSCESSIWLAWDRTGFTIFGNPSKSPTGLHGSAKRPHGNAFASSQNRGEVNTSAGAITENLDYYPYGGIRIDNIQSGNGEGRKYIGQMYDASTQLSYLNSRYFNGTQGQFISQDPVFLIILAQQNISDPQYLNAYSYSEDNPITKSDPSGKCDDPFSFAICVIEAHDLGQGLNDAVIAYQMSQTPYAFTPQQLNSAYGKVGADVTLFVSGENVSKEAGQALDILGAAADAMDQYFGGALKNKKVENNDTSASNQIQLSVGSQGNGNSSFNSFVSANPVMGSVFQPSTQSPNAMGVVYNQSHGSSQQSGGGNSVYQQLSNLLNQLTQLLNSLTQTSNSNQSNNKK